MRMLTTTTAILLMFVFASLAIADERGHLVIVGGGGTPDVVLEKMLELAGGKDAKTIVLPQASSSDDRGIGSVEMFASVGAANAQVVELDDLAAAAKAIEEADLIWFSGGSQRKLAEALRTAKLVDAVRRRYADGAVIGGSSAGAAVMSDLMIPGSPDEQRLVAGNTPISRGFGLAPELIVDQHFVRRNRMNRLLSAVMDHPDRIGVGIDERTAIIVSGKRLTVYGESSVVIIDARGGKTKPAEPGALQTARKIRLDVLSQGDSFDFAATGQGEVPASAEKIRTDCEVLFKNDLRIERAVTANSGSYTLPTFEMEFPYGLKKSVANDSQLREAFTVPLLVLLGEDDTDVNDKYLPRAAEVQAQGKHRLVRGQHFFCVAQDSATRLKCGLNWQMKIVSNVGHDNKKMAPAAARAMFEMSRRSNFEFGAAL